MMRGWRSGLVAAMLIGVALAAVGLQTAQSNAAGPVIVVETTKGTFAFETYPREAPLTVAHVVALVRRGFYDGQRVHRAVPGFLAQWGDPRSRDLGREAEWGRGAEASSGKPIGAAEMSRKLLHIAGAVSDGASRSARGRGQPDVRHAVQAARILTGITPCSAA